MQTNFYKKTGFTLIELIVVMAIIGILSTVLYTSFDAAREQSRDKVRMASLKELQLAIETYKAQNGVYPQEGCGNTTTWTGPGPHSAAWGNAVHCANYIEGLVPDYISKLPTDPNEEMTDNVGFIYQVSADRSAYKALVHRSVETLMITSFDNEFSRCPVAGGSCANVADNADVYGVYSAGAESW